MLLWNIADAWRWATNVELWTIWSCEISSRRAQTNVQGKRSNTWIERVSSCWNLTVYHGFGRKKQTEIFHFSFIYPRNWTELKHCLFRLIDQCWATDMNKRPSFLEILRILEKIKEILPSDNHWHLFAS